MKSIGKEWRDIPGYEGRYQVSNLGRIRSVDCIITQMTQPNVLQRRRWKGRIRKLSICGNYLGIILCAPESMQYVHRLVALTFLPGAAAKKDVNHKNGVKTDNRVENLEWVSRSENQLHAFRVLGRKRVKPPARTRKIVAVKNGEEIHYPSIVAAAQAGFEYSCLKRCLNGRYAQHKGFQWRYADEG